MHAAAFNIEQVRHIEPLLVRYAMRSVRREDLARDLVQETWAAAIVSLPQFEGRSTLRTWMVGILRRKIVDHRRRERDTTSFVDERHGRNDGLVADRRIDHHSAVQEVCAHLSELPTLERRAVELCDVRDLDRARAADELGVTEGHLRVLLHRGRKRLRQSLRHAGYTM